ncbi:recombinase family protein [Streptomyces sp. NPDC050523]|uniref:recombinase family protein n=1 Tax=Streptomyces sp. NPDC050523 TaxID=3365622 RepID=UPI0037A145CD
MAGVLRVSTDQQSTARQNLVLDEAGIEGPVVFEEHPGTSSRLHPLQRPKFGDLLNYARPGDTVHICEIFRLVRGTGHILGVLDPGEPIHCHPGPRARRQPRPHPCRRRRPPARPHRHRGGLPAPELPVTLNMPDKVTDFLRDAELDDVQRAALDPGVTVRRARGYTLRVSAVPAVHLGLLARCQPLDGDHGIPTVPAQRKARREYENRVRPFTPAGP